MNSFHQLSSPAAGAKPQPVQKPDNQALFKLVVQTLQPQGPFTGWREAFPVQERALKAMTVRPSLSLSPFAASLSATPYGPAKSPSSLLCSTAIIHLLSRGWMTT